MTNLVGRTREEIARLVAPLADRPFRSRQVAHWVVDRQATSFAEMTDLPLSLRDRLGGRFELWEPPVVASTRSADGSTKYLFELRDTASVEAVAIPEAGKLTLCLSSQTGCALGCAFCVTGLLGAGRDLGPDEIVGQYRALLRAVAVRPQRVNIVFMGMGEPLLNTANLGPVLDALGETVSPRRITVSTAGVVPGLRWLAARQRRPKLAISLNAPDQRRREALMPIAARYPLDLLIEELERFPLRRGRRITFEYVLIDGFNDARDDATALATLLARLPAKVNLIPLNDDPMLPPGLHRPSDERVEAFATVVRERGLTATVRRSKGGDVAAACGQLKGAHSAR